MRTHVHSPHGGGHHHQEADTGHGEQVLEVLQGSLLARVVGQMFLSRCPWRLVLPVTYVAMSDLSHRSQLSALSTRLALRIPELSSRESGTFLVI